MLYNKDRMILSQNVWQNCVCVCVCVCVCAQVHVCGIVVTSCVSSVVQDVSVLLPKCLQEGSLIRVWVPSNMALHFRSSLVSGIL